jgi:hypothetical protein
MFQSPRRPDTEEVFTMQPRVRSRCGIAAREPWKTPPAFTAITRSHSSGFAFVAVLPAKMPALFTITCSTPNFFTTPFTIDSTWRHFDTSHTRVNVLSGGRSRATRSMLREWSPTSTTFAPSCEKRRAVASPIPDPAPVTITTLPSNRILAPS